MKVFGDKFISKYASELKTYLVKLKFILTQNLLSQDICLHRKLSNRELFEEKKFNNKSENKNTNNMAYKKSLSCALLK